jgi:hypothetical protein
MANKIRLLVKSKILKSGLLAGAVFAVLFSCSKSGEDATTSSIDCTGVLKSFSSDVNPIIQSTCTTNSGCHGSDSRNGPGELLMYSQVFGARSTIRSAVLSGLMPQNGSLTSSQKQAIVCWIDSGAPNN